jgi:hypothetical protein
MKHPPITIKQHVFPFRSIARFCGSNGQVSVHFLTTMKVIKSTPGNQLFCATRIWDQRTEAGYMKTIEDEFQFLASKIVNGLNSIPLEAHVSVSKFFALWHLRSHRKKQPEPDHTLNAMQGERLSKDQKEILERKHMIFADTNASVPGRMMLGLLLQREIDKITTRRLYGKRWGIVRANNGEFIIPDVVDLAVVPVSPTISLVCDCDDSKIAESQVAEINRKFHDSATEYLIANDFGKCPL